MEFSYTQDGLFANPSAVDFVDIPIGLDLTKKNSNETLSVGGLFTDAKYQMCEQLKEASTPEAPWHKSCVYDLNGDLIRVVAPYSGNGAFDDYWNPYVDQFLRRFQHQPLIVRIGEGDQTCTTNPDSETLSCLGVERIQMPFRPTPADIFGCASGPFGRPNASQVEKAIMLNICAGFNRGTILDHPINGHASQSKSYKNHVHNVYSKAVHDNEHDGIGYGFPYDDVRVDGKDQSGTLSFSVADVDELTIYVGGIHSPSSSGNGTVFHPGHNTTVSPYPANATGPAHPVITTSTVLPPASTQTCASSTYTIVSGDTLYNIANGFKITLPALLAANPQITTPDLIYAGQVINIPICPLRSGTTTHDISTATVSFASATTSGRVTTARNATGSSYPANATGHAYPVLVGPHRGNSSVA